jgi:hypothetical protein
LHLSSNTCAVVGLGIRSLDPTRVGDVMPDLDPVVHRYLHLRFVMHGGWRRRRAGSRIHGCAICG